MAPVVDDPLDAGQASGKPGSPRLLRTAAATVGLLITIVVAFAITRIVVDWPNILDDTAPDGDFAERYVDNPWRAYLHIGPGLAVSASAASGWASSR